MNTTERLKNSVSVHPLRDELKRLGLRQVEVARHLGVSASSMGHFMGGYRGMPVHLETKLYALVARVRKEAEARERQDA
jgi:predicted XRE-type DNA-binding protein